MTRKNRVPYRTELVPNNDLAHLEIGKEYWIGFSNKLVDWARDASKETVFKILPSYSDRNCATPEVNKYPFVIWTGDGQWEANVWYTDTWSAPYRTSVWNDWVLHIKVSAGNDGLVELWKDGVKVLSNTGQNYAAVDGCGKPMKAPYVKFGIHKSDWKNGNTDSTRREIHIDQVRIGNATAGYGGVKPGSR
jgi:hypothetical protein